MANLFVTFLLIVAGYLAFKSLRAMNEERREAVKNAQSRARAQTGSQKTRPVEDMRECPVCQTFRPQSLTHGCGRQDCPYGPPSRH